MEEKKNYYRAAMPWVYRKHLMLWWHKPLMATVLEELVTRLGSMQEGTVVMPPVFAIQKPLP